MTELMVGMAILILLMVVWPYDYEKDDHEW